jgi:hypothetical protein
MALCAGVSAWVVGSNSADYASGRAGPEVFVPVAAVVLILMGIALRAVRLSFRADATGLLVRNVLRTYRVPVTQVIGFEVGSRFVIGPHRLRVITESGIIPVGAIDPRPDFLLGDLLDIADELDDWLEIARAGLSRGPGGRSGIHNASDRG